MTGGPVGLPDPAVLLHVVVKPPRQIGPLLVRAREDEDVLAVILFGSHARGDQHAGSDVDVCLVMAPTLRDRNTLGRRLLTYASDVDVDVQIFQLLPLYIRRRILKEGRVLLVRDEDALYELACRTVRAFESFRRRYEAYLAQVTDA
jgi:hypothetical protein